MQPNEYPFNRELLIYIESMLSLIFPDNYPERQPQYLMRLQILNIAQQPIKRNRKSQPIKSINRLSYTHTKRSHYHQHHHHHQHRRINIMCVVKLEVRLM